MTPRRVGLVNFLFPCRWTRAVITGFIGILLGFPISGSWPSRGVVEWFASDRHRFWAAFSDFLSKFTLYWITCRCRRFKGTAIPPPLHQRRPCCILIRFHLTTGTRNDTCSTSLYRPGANPRLSIHLSSPFLSLSLSLSRHVSLWWSAREVETRTGTAWGGVATLHRSRSSGRRKRPFLPCFT